MRWKMRKNDFIGAFDKCFTSLKIGDKVTNKASHMTYEVTNLNHESVVLER